MFERYTHQARRVIFFARYEAFQRGDDRITTAHLLLGLIDEKKSRADAAGSLSAAIPDPCEILGIPHRPAVQVHFGKMSGPPLNDNARRVLAYAAQEAHYDEEFWIDTDHLLRGLLRFPNEASPALESIPLDFATVRIASKRHREEFPPAPPSGPNVFASLFGALKPALILLACIALFGLVMRLMTR